MSRRRAAPSELRAILVLGVLVVGLFFSLTRPQGESSAQWSESVRSSAFSTGELLAPTATVTTEQIPQTPIIDVPIDKRELPESTTFNNKSTHTSGAKRFARVTATRLNVRSGPDTTYTVLDQVKRDATLQMLGESSDEQWLHIQTPEDTIGWVHTAWVMLDQSP